MFIMFSPLLKKRQAKYTRVASSTLEDDKKEVMMHKKASIKIKFNRGFFYFMIY